MASGTVLGQIADQGITSLNLLPNQLCRLVDGDYVESSIPNMSALMKFSSFGLTSNDGFLFKHTYFKAFTEPLLLEIPIAQDYTMQTDTQLRGKHVEFDPAGDFNWEADTYQFHQMMTNVPLRTGSIALQLATRDGKETRTTQLFHRGIFEVKLVFVKVS